MKSPCKASEDTTVDSCELSNLHDTCLHCGRTGRDIENWSVMTHEDKKQANLAAKQRLKGMWHK